MDRSKRLSGAELQQFSRVSNARGALDVSAPWFIIFASASVAHATRAPAAYVIAVIIIASRQAALANLAHDAWHKLCFSSRRANDFAGAWFYSYPVGVPFFHDRKRHFHHHRLIGRPNDPDWINYTNEGRDTPGKIVRYLAGRLFGSLFFATAWSVLVTRKPRIALEATETDTGEPAHEMLRVAACQLGLVVGFGVLLNWWSYLVFWLLPLATVTAFCNNLRALAEHVATDPAAPEARLRDIDASLLERVFFSPADFHFHALHHAHPTIPHYLLSRAKSALAKQAGVYPHVVAPGYIRTLWSHVNALKTHSRVAQ